MHEQIHIEYTPGLSWSRFPERYPRTFTGGGWTLRVVSTEDGFDAMEAEWNDLVLRCPCSVFQTFEWTRTWWKHYGRKIRDAQLHLIVLRKDNTVMGIAPFFSEHISIAGLAKARRLVFIGRKTSDYLDILIRNGSELEVCSRLADHFVEHAHMWDMVFLEDIPHGASWLRLLKPILHDRALFYEIQTTAQCPRLSLPASWEDYLARHTKHFRHELRRKEKRLMEDYAAEFETITDASELDTSLHRLMGLHQTRWTQYGEPGVFASRASIGFQREAAQRLFARGVVRLNFLRLRGERAVGTYGFSFRNESSMYVLGMGKPGAAERFSPGRILSLFNIRQAIDTSHTVLDFMRGSEEYKYQLLAENQPNRTMTIYLHPQRASRLEHYRNLNLLYESFVLRTTKEIRKLRTTVHEHGILSKHTIQYLMKRPTLLLGDAKKKVKSPLFPVSLDTRDLRSGT